MNRIKIGAKLSNPIRMITIMSVTVLAGEAMYHLKLGHQIIIVLYLLSIQVISAVTSRYIYGILAALIGTFFYDFQITAPRMGFSFTLGLPATLIIMLLATILTSTITARFKERAVIAFEREQRTQRLYEINQKLLAARNIDSITELTREYLVSHLCQPAILYTKTSLELDFRPRETLNAIDHQSIPLFTDEQKKRVQEIFLSGGIPDEQSLNESGRDVINVPVISKKNVLGVIGIVSSGESLNQNEFTFVQMLAGQVALALEVQHLSDEQARIIVDAEKEKIRGTLLRSVSHDLRTPLTGILGASSTIQEQKNLDSETMENLINGITQRAQWLIRMVENILILTRISDNLKIKKEPAAAEEVVFEAVSIVRSRFSDYTFSVRVPDELLLVPMDGTLISQVLINLLENAAKNSPKGSQILINLNKADEYAKFGVIDNGSGIPEYLIDSLFEVHSTLKEQTAETSRSTGLGLSICKTIIQAHGGSIEGHNRPDGQGAEFSFSLPLWKGADDSDER